MPASRSAASIAAAAPAPSARGAVKWWASEVWPTPRTVARICAPRARAFSPSSSTRTPAPSPMMKPSRRASNGRQTPLVDVASRAANAARASGVSAASEPPATTASASPVCTIRTAVAIALAPAAQADTTPKTGPRSSCAMAMAAEPALPIISGTASGDTFSGPSSFRTPKPASRVPRPPMPVPSTQPIRPGSYAGSSSQPACPSASCEAASANCVKRSERRASLRVKNSSGSKLAHGASPSAMPTSPARQRSKSVSAPTPKGVMAPTPVMTTSFISGALNDEVDRVADRLQVLDIGRVELHAVLVLDDLRQLGEVERVDVELLEGRLTLDRGRLRAERLERLIDGRLDLGCIGGCGHRCVLLSGGHAAIDIERCSGHVCGRVGGEEAHAGGDLVGVTRPARRKGLEVLV